MSCAPSTATFRLLDAYVGWDHELSGSSKNLTGHTDPDGLRLALESPGAVDPNTVLNYLPPRRIGLGCGPCEWYLVTPVPPSPRLLMRTGCAGDWLPVWTEHCDPRLMTRPVAVATRGRRVAVSDAGARKIWIWTRGGERLIAAIDFERPGPIAIAPWGELFVGSNKDVFRFGMHGDARGKFASAPGRIDRIRISEDCTIWIATGGAGRSLKLWRARRDDNAFKPATIDELSQAFKPTGLVGASDLGFCLSERGADGVPVTRCFSWYGRPVNSSEVKSPSPPARLKEGRLSTGPIDSGIPRCRWHRVRIDADVPAGTTFRISVATNELAQEPHPADWSPKREGVEAAGTDSLDFLVDQPRGRYLFLRLDVTGDGSATPVIRRIKLDFPRSTSLEFLPPVYRERPDAEDFTERFLSLFDASLATLDRAIERFPAMLDTEGAPDDILPWLGSFVDLSLDHSWTPDRMRNILRAVPDLYRRRGTVAGLVQAIKLVFDVEPTIQEMASDRRWAGLGKRSQLGAVRLFGRSRARLRLGSSALSTAPLRSFGNSDTDPLIAEANRFRVLVPPGKQLAPHEQERLERLVASQKPAHTVASVRLGGNGFLLGSLSAVGVDTIFGTLPPPVLRENIRLGKASVVWHGARGRQSGLLPGATGVVGASTIME